jgi:multidrug efflux pump subunit AcrA (membrane-fusion protein)
VPLEGVFERFGSQHVYVIVDGIAQRRSIVLGPVGAGFAEVTAGIEPGETIVTEGVSRVVDGSKVQVVPAELPAKPAMEQASKP